MVEDLVMIVDLDLADPFYFIPHLHLKCYQNLGKQSSNTQVNIVLGLSSSKVETYCRAVLSRSGFGMRRNLLAPQKVDFASRWGIVGETLSIDIQALFDEPTG